MRALLIDPGTESIHELDTSGELDAMYRLLGCDDINMVRITANDLVWVDGEGLFKEDQEYFAIKNYDQPLGGRGLVLGVGDTGESTPATITLAQLVSIVTWPDVEFTGMNTSEGKEKTRFGEMFVIRQEAQFKPKGEDK